MRSYHVKIGKNLSTKTPSGSNGVPQGSKLGPILYLIYANDMINVLKNSHAFAYADDTAIVVSHKKVEEANKIMQHELDVITKWSHDNGLVINASKTKVMHIKPSHLPPSTPSLIFHNYECIHNACSVEKCSTRIEQVKTYKYLGVYVDENFKWLTHIQELRKKLRKSAYSLFHLSNCSSYTVLRQAYFSLVESYIRHGITAWGNSTYCNSLQHSQNQILKILLKNKQHNTVNNTNVNIINNNVIYNNNVTNNYINIYNMNINGNNNNTNEANTNVYNNNINSFADINNIHNTSNDNSSNVNVNYNYNVNINNVNNNNISNTIYHNNIANNNNINNTIPHNNNTNNTTSVVNTNAYNNVNNNIVHNNHTINIIRYNSNTNIHNNSTSVNNNNLNNNNNNTNIATKLQILNIKSIYNLTLINEFGNNPKYLTPIDHMYNTRRRTEGRYKVERFRNNYGKNCLSVVLPTILNKLPTNIFHLQHTHIRKKLLKKHYLESQ